LNVHISCVTPGDTSTSVSVASNAISCTVPAAFAGSTGSRPRQSVPGIAAPSIVALGEPTTACRSAPRRPRQCTAIFMPPSLWPGTVHHTSVSAVNGPICTSADAPLFSSSTPVSPSTLRSWSRVPSLVTWSVTSAPAGTSIIDGLTEMSARVTSNSVSPVATAAGAALVPSAALPDAIAIPTMPIASPTTPMTKVITHQPSPWRCSFMSVLLYSGLDPT
jgi:hypothetical protein